MGELEFDENFDGEIKIMSEEDIDVLLEEIPSEIALWAIANDGNITILRSRHACQLYEKMDDGIKEILPNWRNEDVNYINGNTVTIGNREIPFSKEGVKSFNILEFFGRDKDSHVQEILDGLDI